jgi:hypothetical protein
MSHPFWMILPLHVVFIISLCCLTLPPHTSTRFSLSLQANMPSAQFDGFCNLLRWYDLIQHTADSSKLFTPVTIPLPAFVPPPPPAVSTRPAKSTAAASAAPVSGLFPFSLLRELIFDKGGGRMLAPHTAAE